MKTLTGEVEVMFLTLRKVERSAREEGLVTMTAFTNCRHK